MARGFSLIEAMVVVTMLAVLAALAVPSLQPEVKKAQLEGAAESVAAFLNVARTDAITSRRCVRVRVLDNVSPQRLVAEALNTWDCDGANPLVNDNTNPESAPRIVGTGTGQTNLWIPLRELPLPSKAMTIDLVRPPRDSGGAGGTAAGSVAGTKELRWRPTGRVWSRNLITTDDDGAFEIVHTNLDSTDRKKVVGFESIGIICAFPRGIPAPATNSVTCP